MKTSNWKFNLVRYLPIALALGLIFGSIAGAQEITEEEQAAFAEWLLNATEEEIGEMMIGNPVDPSTEEQSNGFMINKGSNPQESELVLATMTIFCSPGAAGAINVRNSGGTYTLFCRDGAYERRDILIDSESYITVQEFVHVLGEHTRNRCVQKRAFLTRIEFICVQKSVTGDSVLVLGFVSA